MLFLQVQINFKKLQKSFDVKSCFLACTSRTILTAMAMRQKQLLQETFAFRRDSIGYKYKAGRRF